MQILNMNKKKINIVDEISNIENQNNDLNKTISDKKLSEDTTNWYNVLNQQLDSDDKE